MVWILWIVVKNHGHLLLFNGVTKKLAESKKNPIDVNGNNKVGKNRMLDGGNWSRPA